MGPPAEPSQPSHRNNSRYSLVEFGARNAAGACGPARAHGEASCREVERLQKYCRQMDRDGTNPIKPSLAFALIFRPGAHARFGSGQSDSCPKSSAATGRRHKQRCEVGL